MKSTIVQVDIDPVFRWVWISRANKVSRQYAFNRRRALKAFNACSKMGMEWSQKAMITTFRKQEAA